MRNDKEKAIQLRLSGKSYKNIRRELGIPISTLAGWFKGASWSKDIRDRLSAEVSWSNPKALKLLAHANRQRWNLKREEYRIAAAKEFNKLKKDPLFLAGIMLYWGEGEKQQKSSIVRLSNSEPEMIRTFNLFLTRILGLSTDKIYAWLLLYPDLIDPVQKKFWSTATGLTAEQFKNSVFIKGRHPVKRLSYGVCTIAVNSRALKERLFTWIELYQDYLRSHALKK